jgi:hypothetical protein
VLQILSFFQINDLVSAFYDHLSSSTKTTFSEEGTVAVFLRPITSFIEIISDVLPTILLSAIIGPIVTTLPRIFLRGIISPFLMGSSSPLLIELTSNKGGPSSNENKISAMKASLLRLAVTMQQQLLVIVMNVLEKELESRRKITEICSEEFERIRRFIAMIDSPISETHVGTI